MSRGVSSTSTCPLSQSMGIIPELDALIDREANEFAKMTRISKAQGDESSVTSTTFDVPRINVVPKERQLRDLKISVQPKKC